MVNYYDDHFNRGTSFHMITGEGIGDGSSHNSF